MEIIDFEISDYEKILQLQQSYFDALIESKRCHLPTREILMLGEHNPVITLGRRANEKNILIPEEEIKKAGIEIYRIERGGDVTYHSPGQLIVYPVIDLERHNLGVKSFMYLMEEAVIRLLYNHGIKGTRVEGATGVWVGKNTPKERKICAMGIKCSRFCTMHGLALNVSNELSGFSLINPCGFQDKGVTSMSIENNKEYPDLSNLKKEFSDIFLSLIFSFKKGFNFPE